MVDPSVDPTKSDYRYNEVKDAHFNVRIGGFGATTRDTVRAQLEAAVEGQQPGYSDN